MEIQSHHQQMQQCIYFLEKRHTPVMPTERPSALFGTNYKRFVENNRAMAAKRADS
jgi:hypothetical protein